MKHWIGSYSPGPSVQNVKVNVQPSEGAKASRLLMLFQNVSVSAVDMAVFVDLLLPRWNRSVFGEVQ